LVNSSSFSSYFEPLTQIFAPQWRADRIRSQITTVRHESADMYSLVIKPGHAFNTFCAGQYIELTVIKDGAWVSRFFSISSSPAYYEHTGLIEISIRIQEKGRITPWLATALKKGSIVNLTQAKGEFILPKHNNDMLMIAGGSGITPLRSMLQQLTSSTDHTQRLVTLMFYARSAEHFLFEKELNAMQADFNWLTIDFINTDTDGVFCEAHLDQSCPTASQRDVYICGPSPMITSARKTLKDAGFQSDRIHYEFFGPEPIENAQTGSANILFSKSNKQISVNDDNKHTLLELAETENTNPVSGCRMGVCHQCICQKKSGVVYNQKTQKYSDTGHQEIQLCISVPVGDVVLDL
jgi:ferredoxin-NADP reductase